MYIHTRQDRLRGGGGGQCVCMARHKKKKGGGDTVSIRIIPPHTHPIYCHIHKCYETDRDRSIIM